MKANGEVVRRQIISASPPKCLIRPLHRLYGETELRWRSTLTSGLGRRVGDDHALGDMRCLLTYRLAPPCASL